MNIEQLKNMGVPIEKIWDILIAQAEVNVKVYCLFALSLTGLFLFFSKKFSKLQNSITDETVRAILFVLYFGAIIAFMVVGKGLLDIVWINPEYQALMEMLK